MVPPVAHDQIAQLPGEVRIRADITKQRCGMRVQPLPESWLGSDRIVFGQKWMSRRGHVDALQPDARSAQLQLRCIVFRFPQHFIRECK